MRMAGMLMVMLGCIGAGIWYGQIYLRKWHNLKNCQKAVMILRNEIMYGRTPLPAAFAQMAARTNGSISRFFDTVSRRLEEGGGPAGTGRAGKYAGVSGCADADTGVGAL